MGDQLVTVVFEEIRQTEVEGRQQYVMLLREREGERRLPIWIGPAEAAAITIGAQRVETQRPMTHDTLKQVVEALGGRPDGINIRQQPGTPTFTAELVVEREDAEPVRLDCRPSDAVALAVRCEPPPEILVPESLFAPPPESAERAGAAEP